jgi:hypothetical protein
VTPARDGSRAGLPPAVRVARAGVLSGCGVLLSVAAHVSGGGDAPPAAGVALLTVLLSLPLTLLPGRPCRPVLGIAGLGLIQAGLHAVFMALGTSCSMAAGTGHAGHAAHAAATCAPATTMPSSGAAMTAAHAVAVVLLALLVARGERAAWYLLTWMLPTLVAVAPMAVPVVRPWLAPWPDQPAPVRPRVVGGVQRRGPPRLVPA